MLCIDTIYQSHSWYSCSYQFHISSLFSFLFSYSLKMNKLAEGGTSSRDSWTSALKSLILLMTVGIILNKGWWWCDMGWNHNNIWCQNFIIPDIHASSIYPSFFLHCINGDDRVCGTIISGDSPKGCILEDDHVKKLNFRWCLLPQCTSSCHLCWLSFCSSWFQFF